MKTVALLVALIFSQLLIAQQNVGIGTTTPQSKLEVRNPLKSDIKIRSNSYNDTTQLILSNKNISEQGTDFNFRSIQEQGLFLSTSSDLSAHNVDNIMVVHPQGRVGIGGSPGASALLDITSMKIYIL